MKTKIVLLDQQHTKQLLPQWDDKFWLKTKPRRLSYFLDRLEKQCNFQNRKWALAVMTLFLSLENEILIMSIIIVCKILNICD
jgi:hypothetical protein